MPRVGGIAAHAWTSRSDRVCAGRCPLGAQCWSLKPPTQSTGQPVARADVELAEHLAQVVRDGVRADEQVRSDLGVRFTVGSELRDLLFLWRELITGLACSSAR